MIVEYIPGPDNISVKIVAVVPKAIKVASLFNRQTNNVLLKLHPRAILSEIYNRTYIGSSG